MKIIQLMRAKLNNLLDKVRRRIAYVPAVSDTISAMKDLGIDLKEEKKNNK
ncbi:hypothetical protein sync_2240 [Synechococcus sp. CC9311]|nr:hypothetical protein sync_2240 [Synechococcus sp. CC9311]